MITIMLRIDIHDDEVIDAHLYMAEILTIVSGKSQTNVWLERPKQKW